MTTRVRYELNGQAQDTTVEARIHLADHLRDRHRLTGTHLGCEHGVCGACTVMVDGRPVRSCINFAVACDGARIRTIEGFDQDPLMQRLREAFRAHHALQCGYCTPGMLVTAYDIVRRGCAVNPARIRRELAGNLCRCTGYRGIVEAIASVGASWAEQSGPHAADPMLEPAADQRPLARRYPFALPVASAMSSEAGGAALVTVTRLADGWRLEASCSPQALWRVLSDVSAVTPCMPGAKLLGRSAAEGREELDFELNVAVGPMRAAFGGTATLELDAMSRHGVIQGRGWDPRSRTSASGRVRFDLSVGAGETSVLDLGIDYELQGALAQYSRGEVVAAITEEMLRRFGENLVRKAQGEEALQADALSGIGLMTAVFWRRLKRFFV